MPTAQRTLIAALAGLVAGLALAGLIVAALAFIRTTGTPVKVATSLPLSGTSATPSPADCFLGHPNSGNTTVIELSGSDAIGVCNDQTDPIRRGANELADARVIVGHDWAPYKICTFNRYGLHWTIWDASTTPQTYAGAMTFTPGGGLCP
jgi:crotonobetainyl-CoA:carnitine CoA-transferase CaiB-like acyl-CoA transferase